MGVKAFPVEGEGPSLETKRCSRGRFLVLLVAIYGLRRLNVGQRHFQEPSLLLSSARTSAPITGVYFGSFFARKGPAFCIGHDPHRQPPFGSLSLFFIDRTDRCMNVCICVRKVLATFPFWKLILSNFVWTLRLILTSNVDIDICEDVLLLFSYWWLLNRLNRLFIFILIWRNWSVSLMI